MTSIGLKQSKVDNCLFFKVEGSRIVVLVIIYVDDILIATSRSEDMRFIQTKLKMSFKMKDMGDLNFFLRMEVTYNQKERVLQLSQVGYAEKILERFNMTKAKPVATPLALGVNLDAEDTDLDHQFPYREAVGSLMYLMLGTRRDLCFSIGMLSRYLDKPREVHVVAVKRVLRYLRDTTQLGIRFDFGKPFSPQIYADSNWANDLKDRKSTCGYICIAGEQSAISWRSMKQ